MSNPRFLSYEDLMNMPKPRWLIEGMFELNSLVMLAGPSYSFKSFLLIDWLMCMASGRNWNGRATVPQKVAYVLGEGKASLVKRINAWLDYNRLSPAEFESFKENFRVTFEVAQLASKASVDNMLADIEQEGFKPDVIAIDTFARSFVGMDENDAKDTGLWIDGADRLRQMGYTVLFLHHTKKNTEMGVQYRGNTAIMGAMDTAFTLVRDFGTNVATLTCNKQKDHDEGEPVRFRRLIVPLPDDPEGSCVLVASPVLDGRFKEPASEPDINMVVDLMIEDGTFANDVARHIALAKKFNLTLEAAKKRFQRAYQKFEESKSEKGHIKGHVPTMSPQMSLD